MGHFAPYLPTMSAGSGGIALAVVYNGVPTRLPAAEYATSHCQVVGDTRGSGGKVVFSYFGLLGCWTAWPCIN